MRTFEPDTAADAKRAVLYLRVSSSGQVKTDYDPEGISIPAQRRKCLEKAEELGVEVVDEYVEPGRSATGIAQRPIFRSMLQRIASQRDVDYILVYSSSRMNRNWMENGAVMVELRKFGVTLVSATENIDDSPLGEAMSGFLAVFNGFQSAANGQDIKYKMGQKAKAGGTIGLAPLGYLNAPDTFEGRTVRSVVVDPARAPHVKLAFELYASGRYGMHEVLEKLEDAGLRSRPTAKYPTGTPISIHTLGKLLRDRYYCGVIVYKGEEYPGRHEALITDEIFERVQYVMDVERGGGTRQRVHNHYLKGFLWCARCKRRLLIIPGRSKSGDQYFYFVCRGRQLHVCDLPPIPEAKMEQAVIAHYATVPLSAELRAEIRRRADAATEASDTRMTQLRADARNQLAALDKEEDGYLDLIGDPDWPQAKLKERLKRVRKQQTAVRRLLAEPETELANGKAAMFRTLELLSQPQELYRHARDDGRRQLNNVLFGKLHVDCDGNGGFVSSDELNEPHSTFVAYQRLELARADRQRRIENGTLPKQDAVSDRDPLVLLRRVLNDPCSSKTSMVGEEGIEPSLPKEHDFESCAYTSSATRPNS